jgi:hypothetical protein
MLFSFQLFVHYSYARRAAAWRFVVCCVCTTFELEIVYLSQSTFFSYFTSQFLFLSIFASPRSLMSYELRGLLEIDNICQTDNMSVQ